MSNIKKLAVKYKLSIISPFTFETNGKKYRFDALIKGYGAKNGMVVDRQYQRLEVVVDELMNQGYGFSCFDIFESDEGFDNVLNDWGRTDA
ncbi:MAG: hypothetical protein HWE16_18940 [Gammaproteobacteria bacterium]|nr:hypothetical protein [Gammaproteobacteria bacterium]